MLENHIQWSSDLAYAIGLIASDGCLSKDGRHIDFTSKDYELVESFAEVLGLKNQIGTKGNAYRVQFSNVRFYRFLLSIGLTPNKSKTIKKLDIPTVLFADFLRGEFDGDGCSYSYYDKRWKNSFMFYISFISGSIIYLEWLRDMICQLYKIEGKIGPVGKSNYQLRFAKKNSIILVSKMYYENNLPYLKRKHSKILSALGIIHTQAGVAKLVDALS